MTYVMSDLHGAFDSALLHIVQTAQKAPYGKKTSKELTSQFKRSQLCF